MQITTIPNGKRYTTEKNVVEATLVRRDGSTKHYVLTVDGERVAYLSRAGSSPNIRRILIHAPDEYRVGDYIGTFDGAVYEIAMAGHSWLEGSTR